MLDDSIRRIVLLLFFWLLGISTVWNSAAFAIQSDDKGGSEENPAWANTSQQDPFLIKENISGKLMPRYGFRIPSMALLLHSDGRLSAHLLFSGVQIWSVDTGGSVLNAKIEEHPTPDASHDDPLALPFWVKGDMLFTRKCFQCTATDSSASSLASSSSSSNTADADAFSEDAGFPPWHSPSPAHPNFFINLSALITRGHMLVGTTDIYVTTKARIMDVSSYDGKPIESTYSLLPHLHIVRYDVTVCAHRPGKYKWQLNVAQYRLTEASLSRASGNVLEEEHPSFISRVLQGLLHEEGTNKDLQRLDDAMQDLELQPFNEEYPIEKQLRIREVDLCNYMLWNSHDNAPLWSEPILAEDVTGAYAWITERSIVYRLPVYRLTPPKTVGTALVTSIDTDVEARFWQLTTWDVDIAADEREARELQSSYDMCHWAYSTALLPLIPNYTEGGEQSLVAFQFLPTVSQLWTLTAARRTVFFTFHVLCFLISLGFICLGVIPRRRLRNAWAQLDSLMDDLRQSSRPNSTKLLPSDHALKDGDSARIVEETNNVLATTDSENDLNSSPDCLSLDYQATYMRDPEKGSGDPLHREDGGDDFWWRTGGRVEDEAGSLVDNSSLNELRSGNTVTRSPRANSNAVSPHLFQQHFVVIEKIGWGAEGCVFCVEHRFTRVKYAIKAIHIKYEEQERCVGEALLHSALDFSNVVRFFYCWFEDFTRPEAESLNLLRNEDSLELRSVYTDDSSPTISRTESILSLNADAIYRILFIQMEYFPRGTLADYFRKRDRFTRLENLEHILQIANGLRYIHEQLVVHRDLKPTNIFLSESGVVKIGDFGLAKKRSMHGPSPRVGADELGPNFVLCEEERSIAGGSPLYCSPEQLEGKPATPESDIYSLGVIAVESYCLFNTLHERFRTLEEARRGVIAEAVMGSYPDEMKLFQAMLLERKEGRPSVNYIIQKLNHFIKAEKSGREKMSNTVKAKAVLHNGSEIESESMGSTQEVLKENSRKAFEERQLDSFGSPIQ